MKTTLLWSKHSFRMLVLGITILSGYAGKAQTTLPYTADFTNGNANFVSGGTNSSWEYGTNSSGQNGWATNLDGNYNNSEESYVETPIFDFSDVYGGLYMGLDLSYSLESGYDYSWIEMSVDGGISFSVLTGDELEYTSSNKWNGTGNLSLDYFNISSASGQSQVVFRFYLDSDGSATEDGLFLSRFNILGSLNHDVAVYEINVPETSASLTDQEEISVSVMNYGLSTESSIPLTAMVEGPGGTEQISETLTSSLATDDSDTYTFSHLFDFSAAGNYTVSVYSGLSTEVNLTNDTLTVSTGKLSVYSSGLPYFETFDELSDTTYQPDQAELTRLQGWSYNASASNGSLTVTNSTSVSGNSLHLSRSNYSGLLVENNLVLTLDLSDYSVDEDDLLLDFEFSVNYSYGYDNNRVFVRGSESDEWVELYNWYANQNAFAWTAVSYLSLSDALAAQDQEFSSTTQVRFGEKNYWSGSYYGLYLDEVKVYTRPAHDVAVYSIDVPEATASLTDQEEISVSFVSHGSSTENSIPLTALVTGPSGTEQISETLTSSLATDDSDTYTFSHLFDFSAAGNYTVTVYSGLSTDENLTNDTLTVRTGKLTVYSSGLPYFETFDELSDTTYQPDQAELSGLQGWSYNASASIGSLTVTNSTSVSGNSLYLSSSNDLGLLVENNLVLTLDLSDYSVDEDDLLLDFQFSVYYSSDYDNNRVFVRGSESDEWVELYNWYANQASGYAFDWTAVS